MMGCTALHERIRELLTLEKDWDSYGAFPVNANAASLMMQVVNALSHEGLDDLLVEAEIFPGADGSLQIETQGKRAEVELAIGPDGSYDFLVCPHGSDSDAWIGNQYAAGTPIGTIVQTVRDAA